MKKLLYMLCCLICIGATIYAVYYITLDLITPPIDFREVLRAFGVGYFIKITYMIVMKKYKWVQKICK